MKDLTLDKRVQYVLNNPSLSEKGLEYEKLIQEQISSISESKVQEVYCYCLGNPFSMVHGFLTKDGTFILHIPDAEYSQFNFDGVNNAEQIIAMLVELSIRLEYAYESDLIKTALMHFANWLLILDQNQY